MGEVRACVYFSVIFLCIQISAAKPFLDSLFCEIFCEEDDGPTTTASTDADMIDIFCRTCFPVPTPMPPAFASPATPSPPGMPGQPGSPGFNQAPGMGPGSTNYIMMNPPLNGGDPNRNGWWSFVWNQGGSPGAASAPPPNATPAPAPAAPATPAAAPAAAATTAAPAVTTAAPAA